MLVSGKVDGQYVFPGAQSCIVEWQSQMPVYLSVFKLGGIIQD